VCVAVVLQCVLRCLSIGNLKGFSVVQCVASVLQCVAVCCIYVAVCVAVVLQRVCIALPLCWQF